MCYYMTEFESLSLLSRTSWSQLHTGGTWRQHTWSHGHLVTDTRQYEDTCDTPLPLVSPVLTLSRAFGSLNMC